LVCITILLSKNFHENKSSVIDFHSLSQQKKEAVQKGQPLAVLKGLCFQPAIEYL